MLYFDTFPLVVASDYKNNAILLTNLMARVEIIPSLLKNPLLFYSYDLKESDRPDIIAHKYYDDSNKYWMVLYANEIMDPLYDWPLTSQQFDAYLKNKYSAAAGGDAFVLTYTTSTVQEYRKTITTYDSTSLETTIKTVVVDLTTYNSTTTGSITQTFFTINNGLSTSTGASVTRTISKTPVSIYDYEMELNEAKQNIKLINSSYSNQLENDLKTLMAQ
jgi:hypothetical protein